MRYSIEAFSMKARVSRRRVTRKTFEEAAQVEAEWRTLFQYPVFIVITDHQRAPCTPKPHASRSTGFLSLVYS